MLLTTHARDPDLAINMGAISDHEFVKGQYLCTKSMPSPSSKTAPPTITSSLNFYLCYCDLGKLISFI